MNNNDLENKVWYRLLKVLYIISYIPLPFLLLLVLSDFGRDYNPVINSYTWNIRNAIQAFAITSLIYILIVELFKKAILYIILGKRK